MRPTAVHFLGLPLLAALYSCGSSSPEASPDAGLESDAGVPDATVDGCSISPGQMQWIVEGESLEVVLYCQSGASLSDLTIDELPTGASFDPSTNTLSWTPGLDQAATYSLPVQAPSLFAEGRLQISVADALGAPGNLPIADMQAYTHELGLPVFFLEAEPASNEDYQSMEVIYGGTRYLAEAKLRGKSSLSYPKKSYALRFDKFSSFNEHEYADFGNRRRVILTSTFDDNSYLRQRLAYDLWNALEPTIQIQNYLAVVYRGTEYRGVYTVTDHVNVDLMRRSGLSEEGNLYKAEDHDANYYLTDRYGDAKTSLNQGYSKTEGLPDEGEVGAFSDLEDLVQFVAESDDLTFNAEIENWVDVDDYAAWWILATFSVAYDSAGKNSYHYHDASRTWRVTPWDFNASFGQSWETEREDAEDNVDFFNRNQLFQRLIDHPTLGPDIRLRYQNLLETGPLSQNALTSRIDGYVEELNRSGARDWAVWGDTYQAFERWDWREDFTDHQGELAYLRAWLQQRREFALETYPSSP